MKKNSKIYLAGHTGLAGSAILKNLRKKGYENIIFRTHAELDLTNQSAVAKFFAKQKPEYVILAAARVGGILANNTYRANFIYENLAIQNNVIHQSYLCGIKKLLFLGSTCIYPKESPQPISEDSLLTGCLEYTNEPYAIAKIAGIKLCESYNLQYDTNFIAVMPTNLYGPNDNFDLEKSHVLPALIRKMHLGKCLEQNNFPAIKDDLIKKLIQNINDKTTNIDIVNILDKYGIRRLDKHQLTSKVSVEVWGSGKPRREFLYSEDMADACVYIMQNVDFKDTYNNGDCQIRNTQINIGTGKDISISELAYTIKDVVGFTGDIVFNTTKADGTMFKLTNCNKINNIGWKESVSLIDGIKKVYAEYASLS